MHIRLILFSPSRAGIDGLEGGENPFRAMSILRRSVACEECEQRFWPACVATGEK